MEKLITVITPSYNTPKELFKVAFDSMMAQELSKEQIEWIIVVHNSTEEHLADVKSMAADNDFIRVFELHNDKRTASSPRNYGLGFATGKYLTFLDADDELTPECLGTIVAGMEESGAQVGKYRSEKREEDDEIISFLDNRVRFDQTKPLITINREDKDMSKLMTMANMMMSCQVVDRAYLEEHHIRFREDVRIYEDVVFNLECLKDAETVAVFPQLIGYIYFMRHGSTMQELKIPTAEEILSVCRDVATQLQIGLDAGLYMRYLFFGHMKLIADMIVAASSGTGEKNALPDSAKKEIRELIGPFYEKIDPPLPERKFLSQEEIDEIFADCKSIILQDGGTSGNDSESVLYEILRDNEETELGENWGFDTIRSTEVYAEKVPQTDYDFYAPMIELMTRVGESDILFLDPIIGYAVKYGSMGTPKRIPITKKSFEAQIELSRRMLQTDGSVFLLAESIRPDKKSADQVYFDSLLGSILRNLEGELRYESSRITEPEKKAGALTTPAKLIFHSRPVQPFYLRLLFALADPDVSRIVSPSAATLLEAFRYLEKYYDQMTDDIEGGDISPSSGVSEDERDEFRELLREDPARASHLREVFATGFDEPVAPKIWPGLKDVIAQGNDDQLLYKEHLKRYIGDIPIKNACCMSEEAMLGTEASAEPGIYLLQKDNAYFEFLSNGEVQDKLIEGEEYRMLLTSHGGLYRYLMDEIIRIKRIDSKDIYFECPRRAGDMMDVRDGAIESGDISRSVIELENRLGLTIEDYFLAESWEDGGLVLYLEPSMLGDSEAKLLSIRGAELDTAADEDLQSTCPAYKEARTNGMKMLRTEVIEQETHLALREQMAYLQKLPMDMVRPVHILHNPAHEKFVKMMTHRKG